MTVRRAAVLFMGDAGWEQAHSVVNGTIPDLLLSAAERLWLRACWQPPLAPARMPAEAPHLPLPHTISAAPFAVECPEV